MVGIRLLFVIIYFLVTISITAQLTHEFKLICESNELGNALDITFDTQGRVYLANGADGLRIYQYNNAELIPNFHYTDSDTNYTYLVENVEVSPEGEIFFCGTLNLGAGINDIYKLYICEISNNSLRVLDEIGSNWDGKPNYFTDIAFGKDRLMFLSNSYFLHAYEYVDSSFLSKAILDIDLLSDINDIEIDEEDIIYIAADKGLYAYRFEESTFTELAKVSNDIERGLPYNIDIGKSGLVYLANGKDGLRIYIFDGREFLNTAHIKADAANPTIDVGVGTDGTIFTLNYCGELSAYLLINKQLIKTASTNLNNCDYRELKIRDDLYVFVISNEGKLQVFEYMMALGVEEQGENPLNYTVLIQNYPNPFNPSTHIKYSISKQSNVTLKVYDLLGNEVATLVNKLQPHGNYKVKFDGSQLTSGIYFYRFQACPANGGIHPVESGAGEYVETKKMILLK